MRLCNPFLSFFPFIKFLNIFLTKSHKNVDGTTEREKLFMALHKLHRGRCHRVMIPCHVCSSTSVSPSSQQCHHLKKKRHFSPIFAQSLFLLISSRGALKNNNCNYSDKQCMIQVELYNLFHLLLYCHHYKATLKHHAPHRQADSAKKSEIHKKSFCVLQSVQSSAFSLIVASLSLLR